jgi:tetratricopeptide (TPR) repeat protein
MCTSWALASEAKKVSQTIGNDNGIVLLTPEPHTAQEHNNRAVELGSKELWVDAIREHELAVELDQSNSPYRTNLSAAHLLYGKLCKEKHNLYDAARQFRAALFVDPKNAEADQNLDEVLNQMGKASKDAKVRQSFAEDADLGGDFETAIVEYRKCAQLLDDGPTHAELGRSLLRSGLPVDAFKELSIGASKPWPADDSASKAQSDCHASLGNILREYARVAKEGGKDNLYRIRLRSAGIEYRRAVTINPLNTNAILGLVDVAQQAVALNPTFDNHLTLASAYQLQGDFGRARLELDACRKLTPSSPEIEQARKSLCLAEVKSSTTTPAALSSIVATLKLQLKQNSSDAKLWYIYGFACERQSDRFTALDAYKHALTLDAAVAEDLSTRIERLKQAATANNSPSTGAAPATEQSSSDKTGGLLQSLRKYSEIEALLRSGKLDQAKEAILAQIQISPRAGRAWLLLGLASERANETDFAIAAYHQADNLKEPGAKVAAESLNTARVAPLIAQGDELAKSGDWARAASLYRQATILDNDLPNVHRKLADALQHLGDDRDASLERKQADELEQSLKTGT